MIEVQGNFWESTEDYRAITTNGMRKKNGNLIMGAGIALQASLRYPHISKILGEHVRENGNTPCLIEKYKVISFPTKENWQAKAIPELIISSATLMKELLPENATCALTRAGCGNGGLVWSDVKLLIEPILDDRFHVYK